MGQAERQSEKPNKTSDFAENELAVSEPPCSPSGTLSALDRQMDPAIVVLLVVFVALPLLIYQVPGWDFAHLSGCELPNVGQGDCGYQLAQQGQLAYALRTPDCQLDASLALRVERISGVIQARALSHHEMLILISPWLNLQQALAWEIESFYPLVP